MNKKNDKKELVIERIFDAPRELVWKAWAEPEMFKSWWGPKEFTCPFVQIDFREGGTCLSCMRGPEGKDFWSTSTYKEIVPLRKIVATDSFADEHGNVVSSTHYRMEGFQLEMEITLLLEDVEGKTRMILRHVGLPEGEMKDQTATGWNESFDKLAEVPEQLKVKK